MITASIKNGVFTYQYRKGKCKVIIRGTRKVINLAIPYLLQKIKKAAQ